MTTTQPPTQPQTDAVADELPADYVDGMDRTYSDESVIETQRQDLELAVEEIKRLEARLQTAERALAEAEGKLERANLFIEDQKQYHTRQSESWISSDDMTREAVTEVGTALGLEGKFIQDYGTHKMLEAIEALKAAGEVRG